MGLLGHWSAMAAQGRAMVRIAADNPVNRWRRYIRFSLMTVGLTISITKFNINKFLIFLLTY
jgi:hypothetical protein